MEKKSNNSNYCIAEISFINEKDSDERRIDDEQSKNVKYY